MLRFPSPSLVISMLALMVALGGAGYSATGGTFILGQTNSATSQTRLVAPFAGAAFRIDNTSTAAVASGLNIVTDAARPPLVVSSSVKVANLNVDKLDGLSSNQLARVGRGFKSDFGSGATFSDAASIRLTIPQAGFVLVTGNVNAISGSVDCNPCYVHALLLDKTTHDVSPVMIASVGNGSAATDESVIAVTWVFPVIAGARTFALQTAPAEIGSDVGVANPAITALYVPFGPTGTLDLTGGLPQSIAAKSARLGPARNDGRRAILR
jgi:hypothetical protein